MKNLLGSSCALAVTLVLVSGCGGDDTPFAEDAGSDAFDDTGVVQPGPDATSGKPDASKTPDATSDTGSELDVTVPTDTGPGADVTVPDTGSTADAGDGSTTQNDASEGDASDGGGAAALPPAVAIWEFQDPAGSLVALDSSGNNHTATLKGTAAIVGTFGLDAGTPDAGSGEAGTSEAGVSEAGVSEAGSEAGTSDDGGAGEAGGPETGAGDAGSSSSGPDAFGNYLQIDGTIGAFADVTGGPLFDNTKSFTLSTWVYFPSLNNQYDELLSIDGAHVSVGELQLAPTNGGSSYNMEATFPTQDIPQPGVFFYAFSTNPVPAASWTHLVGVYNLTSNPGTTPGGLSLYVNGVLQSNGGDAKAIGVNPVAAVGDFIIGAGKYNDARTPGAVANYVGVRVYAQALTAAQVTALYGIKGR